MIHKVRIQNFKSLRDVSIDLERFTVFVGANGSGKTSVLEAIDNAVRAATGDPQKVFAHERHGDWVYTRSGEGESVDRAARQLAGAVTYRGVPRRKAISAFTGTCAEGTLGIPASQTGELVRTRIASMLAGYGLPAIERDGHWPGRPTRRTIRPEIEFTGGGLASVLAFMAPQRSAGVRGSRGRYARTLIPRLQPHSLPQGDGVPNGERAGPIRQGHGQSSDDRRAVPGGDDPVRLRARGERLAPSTASEGTMLMLGLLTVLLGPTGRESCCSTISNTGCTRWPRSSWSG